MKLSKSLWFALVLMLTVVGIETTAFAQGGDVPRGQQLYIKNCAVCHGERAEGRVGATLARDFPGIRVASLLKEEISAGIQGSVMPAWSKANGGPLTDAEIDDIVAFIRSLGNQAPTAPTVPMPTRPLMPPTVVAFPPGDVARGTTVYAQNCAVCHGERGEGRVGAGLQKDWAGINVDALIESTVARGLAGTRMPAWARSNGGPLTDQEIADVTAFVRTLKPVRPPASSASTQAPSGDLFGGVLTVICVGLLVLFGLAALAIILGSARKPTASA